MRSIADSRQTANRLVAKLRATQDARGVQATLALCVAAQLSGGDAAPATVADQAARVRQLLDSVLKFRIDELTERKATAIYDRATTAPSLKVGRPLRAASHRFYLSIVQCMWKWAQKQGHAKDDSWADVEPIGRVSAGKPQLRRSKARRFAQLAEQEAAAGSERALCCLSLGLRASEALGLTVRDIDVEASEVFVSGTKTAAARRRLRVPSSLSTLLGRTAAGRPPGAYAPPHARCCTAHWWRCVLAPACHGSASTACGAHTPVSLSRAALWSKRGRACSGTARPR